MLKVTYYVACSLDGFIADSKGGLDWLRPFEGTGEDYGYAAFYASVDAVLLGRVTFDFCRTHKDWPYAGKPTWIFSHSQPTQLPPDAFVTSDPPSVVVKLLQSHGHRHAYLVGGGQLAASFRAQELITNYIVSVVPVILGDGLPMIVHGDGINRLELIRSQAFASGIVQVEYRSGM